MTNLKIKSAKNAILDALFPVFCFSCRKEGSWLCKSCLNRIEIQNYQICPACEKNITDKGILCFACRDTKKSCLDGLIVAVSYKNETVKKLVHNFKYRFIPDIAESLANLISKALIQNDLPLPDFLAPIPLHPKRLRWRGFNQSLLLATHISEKITPLLKIEILDILERKRFNPPQMGIKSYQERIQNVKDIFSIKQDADCIKIKNKYILIIDDIATTGATIEECAKTLKSIGAKKVFAAVVARQSAKK